MCNPPCLLQCPWRPLLPSSHRRTRFIERRSPYSAFFKLTTFKMHTKNGQSDTIHARAHSWVHAHRTRTVPHIVLTRTNCPASCYAINAPWFYRFTLIDHYRSVFADVHSFVQLTTGCFVLPSSGVITTGNLEYLAQILGNLNINGFEHLCWS